MAEPEAKEVIAVTTTRFGTVEVPKDKVLTMPQGMVGFPLRRKFALLEHRPGSSLNWLQSLEEPSLAFVVAPPILFDPKYQFRLRKAELSLLQVEDPKQIQVWAVVTIPHDNPGGITANLKAPVVLNAEKRLAAQVILDDPKLQVRHPLKVASKPQENNK